MILKGIARFILLHFCPRRWIVHRLQKLLGAGGFMFYPHNSGRAAIFALATKWSGMVSCRTVLLPEYLCNAVHTAFIRAGYAIRTYQTNDLFEPDADEIQKAITSGQIGILVTANIFGSSAFLSQLASHKWQDFIIKHNVRVMVDLCQDISLLQELPTTYADFLAAVVSFNDKSFPGVMGGGILAKGCCVQATVPMSLRQRLTLYYILLRKAKAWCRNKMNSRRARRHPSEECLQCAQPLLPTTLPPFEYSYCRRFPFTCETFVPSKLQLIMALVGLANLKTLHLRKRRFAQSCLGFRQTRHFLTAPYLVCDSTQAGQELFENKLKGSYALQDHPKVSLRPDLLIVHNKGFFDIELH